MVNKVDAPQVEQLRAFSYDNRGNVTSNGFRSFGFNIANQLQGSLDNNYLYDGHNRRVRQTDSQGTSYSLYSQDGTLLYRETDDGPINYIYLGKKLIAKDGFVADKSADQHFYPYGSSVEGEVDDIGYTGHKFDKDLGLVYMQARYYDPMIGRFYSNDPIDAIGHLSTPNSIHGFNRYAYANNNPYKFTDPTGMTNEFIVAAQQTVDQLRGDVSALFGGKGLESAANNAGLATTREAPVAQPTSKTVSSMASLHPASRLATAIGLAADAVTAVRSGSPDDIAVSPVKAVAGEALTDNLSNGGAVDLPKTKVAVVVAITEGVGIAASAALDANTKDIEEK